MAQRKLNVLGVMSGTSLDGTDFVLTEVKFNPLSIKYLGIASSLFPKKLKQQLTLATQRKLRVEDLAYAHHSLGRYYSNEILKHKKVKRWEIDLVGLHGQTVFHDPPRATLQIGEPSYISEKLRIPVVSDFRVADLALGGQGAPLATFFHAIAFQELWKNSPVTIHNLGGISNVSFFDGAEGSVMSFDTGPANMLIDLLIQTVSGGKQSYDKSGNIAASGLVSEKLVKKMIAHNFFFKKPPKSCGREEFGESYLNKYLDALSKLCIPDQLATITELTARSIAVNYHRFLPRLPKTIIFCGGGAKNKYLLSRIKFHIPQGEVYTSDAYNWPTSAIEGGAFALMAACRVAGIPAHIPKTTGAKRIAILGKISEP